MNVDNIHSAGFTLIELMVSVLLLALLGGAAALSLSTPIRNARAADAIGMIRAADAQARQQAITRQQSVLLRFDKAHRAIERVDAGATQMIRARVEMPWGFQLDRITTAQGDAATIEVSPSGFSRSYVTHLTGPSTNAWLVVAGLSGQVSLAPSESAAMGLLSGPQ